MRFQVVLDHFRSQSLRFFWSRDPSNDESGLSSLLPPGFNPFGRVQELETEGLGKIMNTLG